MLNKKTQHGFYLGIYKLVQHLELIVYFVFLWFPQKENIVLAENQYVNVKYYYSPNSISIFYLQYLVEEEEEDII